MPTWPIQSIKELLEPTLTHMGYGIYSVDQSGAGGRTLRIAIDRPEGITLDDCERVSQLAGPLLDQADLIDQTVRGHRIAFECHVHVAHDVADAWDCPAFVRRDHAALACARLRKSTNTAAISGSFGAQSSGGTRSTSRSPGKRS